MKTLEVWLYKEIYDSIERSIKRIYDYLEWNITKEIESIQRHRIDESFKILFNNKKLSNEEKSAILALVKSNIESHVLSTLRLFEWDLYECEWYAPKIDPDDYSESHPDYQGGLIRVTDLEWKSITDNSMYENFIRYIEERKSLK